MVLVHPAFETLQLLLHSDTENTVLPVHSSQNEIGTLPCTLVPLIAHSDIDVFGLGDLLEIPRVGLSSWILLVVSVSTQLSHHRSTKMGFSEHKFSPALLKDSFGCEEQVFDLSEVLFLQEHHKALPKIFKPFLSTRRRAGQDIAVHDHPIFSLLSIRIRP